MAYMLDVRKLRMLAELDRLGTIAAVADDVIRNDGDLARARTQFEKVINGKPLDYNDRFYKQQAAREIKELR